jgi:hypothetical protein
MVSFQLRDLRSLSVLTQRELVPLEQKYALYGIPVKSYAPRGKSFPRKERILAVEHIEEEVIVGPEPVPTPSTVQPPSRRNGRPLKRTYAMAGQ